MDAFNQISLIALSSFFYHGLYYILKLYVLPGRVIAVPSESRKNLPGHAEAVVASRIVSLCVSSLCGLAGTIIMWETGHDIVMAKSSYLIPATCFVFWYFVYDIFCMYDVFALSWQAPAQSAGTIEKLHSFVSKMGLIIFHHMLFVLFALPGANGFLTNNKCEALIGFLYLMEFSTPFISLHFILEHTSYRGTIIQYTNGLFFIVTFLIFRIVAIPYMYWLYAHQYHNGSIMSAFSRLYGICHFAAWGFFIIQIFWFYAAINKFTRKIKELIFSKKEH